MASLLETLKEEFYRIYLDKFGLCKLQDEAEENLEHVRNDNGILFSSYGHCWLRKLGIAIDAVDKTLIIESILKLQVMQGLFKRRHDADLRSEAHDNADAVVALDILTDNICEFSKDICLYSLAKGGQFNNVFPEKWSWNQLRQPGSLAYYKIGAGFVPYPLEMVWMCLGMIYAMAFGWASTHNLAWLKLETIPIALAKYGKNDALWGWVKSLFGLTQAICAIISRVKKIFLNQWKNYFGDKHIITRMAQAYENK